MTVIVPKSHFVQISREVLFRHAMELGEPFLGVVPKAFQAININLASGKALPMVHSQVAVTTEHQGIIPSEFVRVNNGAPPDHFHGLTQQAFSRDVLDHGNLDFSVSLEDTEDRNLSSSPSTAVAFTTATEVGFIQFDLARSPEIAFSSHQSLSYEIADTQNGRITQPDLGGNFMGRNVEFKELDDPQQLFQGNAAQSDPSIREVMKGISTPLTTVFFAFQTIDSVTVTTTAENMAIFPAEFPEEQFRPVFCFPYEFKGFQLTQSHMHKIILVQDVL
jgi:hypothetical protein